MIELCNEAQKDMWINIPVMATPQFVQSLAQLIYTDLDPNLNVYVEYGNENWNTGFTQYNQVLTAAELNPLVTQSSNTLQMVAQQSAYEEVSDAQIFEQEFGSDVARIRPIMSGWFARCSLPAIRAPVYQPDVRVTVSVHLCHGRRRLFWPPCRR